MEKTRTSTTKAALDAKATVAPKKAGAGGKAAAAKKAVSANNATVPKKAAVARPSDAARESAGRTKAANPADASQMIDARIAELPDWRGETLARLREIIRRADPDVVEEWKWGIPVWSHAGILCTGEVYRSAVKTTFAKGAALDDPSGLFNSSLEGNTRRAIDFRVGDAIEAKAFAALIRAAVALNTAKTTAARPGGSAKRPASAAAAKARTR